MCGWVLECGLGPFSLANAMGREIIAAGLANKNSFIENATSDF